jgi:transcriptional regulator with XRE-family HTH domain
MIRLKAIRKERQVSLRGLSQTSSVAVAILARIEAGYSDPRLSTLRRVANALNVTIGELIGEADVERRQLVFKQRRDGMKRMSERNKEELRKLREASRLAKQALDKWRKQYIIEGMSPHMWDYDLEEVELLIKILHLKLRNQQAILRG